MPRESAKSSVHSSGKRSHSKTEKAEAAARRSNKLKACDMFGMPITFNLKGETLIRTRAGSFLSCILALVFIYYLAFKLLRFSQDRTAKVEQHVLKDFFLDG